MMPAVAALIRDGAGHVLMHQRADSGAWEVPGGAKDPGEPPAKAVVREVLEETGLRVVPVRVVAVIGGKAKTHPNGDQTEPTSILFECRVVGGRLEARDGEASAFCYVPPEEMPEQFGFPRHVFAEDFCGVYFEWDEGWLGTL